MVIALGRALSALSQFTAAEWAWFALAVLALLAFIVFLTVRDRARRRADRGVG